MPGVHSRVIFHYLLTFDHALYRLSRIRELSKKLVVEGVASARQLYNLEKAERKASAKIADDASSGSMSDEDKY